MIIYIIANFCQLSDSRGKRGEEVNTVSAECTTSDMWEPSAFSSFLQFPRLQGCIHFLSSLHKVKQSLKQVME